MHDDAYIGGRSENNIKCVVHDDFLSFVDVELIWFFHGSLQFKMRLLQLKCPMQALGL